SSTELSTTSYTIWCSPVPSSVSPMYIPGRFRTASSPFRTVIFSAVYSPAAPVMTSLIERSCFLPRAPVAAKLFRSPYLAANYAKVLTVFAHEDVPRVGGGDEALALDPVEKFEEERVAPLVELRR